MYYTLVLTLSSLILYIACTNLLPFKLNLKCKISIFIYIILTAYFLCPIISQAATPITLLGVLIIIYISDSRKLLNICSSLFGYGLSVVMNYFILFILESYFKIDLNKLWEYHTIEFSAIFCVIIYIVTLILKYLLWKKIRLQDMKLTKHVIFFVFINLFVCVMIFVFNFISSETIGYPNKVVLFNSILFSFYFIFSTILTFFVITAITKEQKMKFKLSEYQNLQEYTSKIEMLYMEMRAFKHDYINILSTMSCYINNEDVSGLKEYFNNEIMPLNEFFDQTNTKLGLLSNIKILELKSLLYSKMIYAMSNHINVYLDVAESIDTIDIKIVDLTRVIGIMLDNAIEATLETAEKTLEIGIINKEDSILFIIKNSCINKTVHMNKIYDSGFSTKGPNRGIGLFTAKQILGSYENIIHSTGLKDNYFTQQIEILNS